MKCLTLGLFVCLLASGASTQATKSDPQEDARPLSLGNFSVSLTV